VKKRLRKEENALGGGQGGAGKKGKIVLGCHRGGGRKRENGGIGLSRPAEKGVGGVEKRSEKNSSAGAIGNLFIKGRENPPPRGSGEAEKET